MEDKKVSESALAMDSMDTKDIIRIFTIDDGLVELERDIHICRKEEDIMYFYNTDNERTAICGIPIKNILYFEWVEKIEEKTCSTCKYENEDNWGSEGCYPIVGTCEEYDKWEART